MRQSIKLSLLTIALFYFSYFSNIQIIQTAQASSNVIAPYINQSGYLFLSQQQQPTLVNLFNITCQPCIQEMPELAILEHKYPKIKFIAIHVGMQSKQEINAFLKTKLKNKHPKLIARHTNEKVLQDALGFYGLPLTLLVRNGTIKQKLNGYNATNVKKIKQWLKQANQ